MQMREAIGAVMRRQHLSYDDTHAVMTAIMTGEATQAQIGALLMALSMKGETVDELAAAAQVMRELMTRVTVRATDAVDIVGTGGDGANLFNVSTAASFVVAAAGGRHRPAVPTCLSRPASIWRWTPSRSHAASMISGSASCSRPTITPP